MSIKVKFRTIRWLLLGAENKGEKGMVAICFATNFVQRARLSLQTFDKPLAVPIDRIVSRAISHIARWPPQDLPVALAVSCLATM